MESTEQDIINRTLKAATEEAEVIIKKAKDSAESLLESQRQTARSNAQKKANSIRKRAQKESEIIRGKTATEIRQQAGWTVLSEKNRLIQNVLDEAKNRLENMEKKGNYVDFLEKLTVDAGSSLGGGTLTVSLNDADSKLSLNFEKLAKQIFSKTGVETKLSRSKELIPSAGVIVQTDNAKIFVDNTFESILKRQENKLKIIISKTLFRSLKSN